MTRKEQYEQIINRMHRPENYEKYDTINATSNLCKEDALIVMHLSHIRDFLRVLSNDNDELIATSCDAAIHKVEELLEKRGWK